MPQSQLKLFSGANPKPVYPALPVPVEPVETTRKAPDDHRFPISLSLCRQINVSAYDPQWYAVPLSWDL